MNNIKKIVSEQVCVRFDAVSGKAISFDFIENGKVAETYDSGCEITAVCRRLGGESTVSGCVCTDVKASDDAVEAAYSFECDGIEAGIFSIIYRVSGSGVFIDFGEVRCNSGIHLLEVRLDGLLICGEDTKFVNNRRGGYMSDLGHINADCNIVDDGEWRGYPNMSIFPFLALIKKRSVCVTETLGYVCSTMLSFDGGRISFGVHAPYMIMGGDATPDIPVNQREICRIDFGGDIDGNGEINWLDAAKLAREHIPPLPDAYFDDKIVYIIQNQLGRKDADLTFAETEELIRRISNLIDGAPHVAMLTGWSQGGHDTSYPNIFKMNPALGGEEEFFRLKKTAAEKYNCNVSLNDNFDDQYKNEYTEDGHFDLDNIGVRQDGTPETFNAWNGVDVSYITGMAKYMEDGGHGERRIDWECEHYGVRDAMLIDALSWWSVRHDWNPDHPASAVDNIRAKHKIIDRFRDKYGVHILSELVRYPLIGKLCVAFDNNVCFWHPTDGDVPFMRTVLLGRMYYGQKPGDSLDMIDFLYHNAAKHPWFRRGESPERICDIYYLNYVPWFIVKSLDMLSYSCSGGVYDMHLEGDVHIHIDHPGGTWFIKQGENTILQNRGLSCPMAGGRVAFYSKTGGRLSYTLPDGASAAGARRLYDSGAVACDFDIDGSVLTVECEPNVPVIVDCEGL